MFIQGKCRALHLVRSNLLHLLECSSPEKELGVLVDNKFTISQQWVLVANNAKGLLEA